MLSVLLKIYSQFRQIQTYSGLKCKKIELMTYLKGISDVNIIYISKELSKKGRQHVHAYVNFANSTAFGSKSIFIFHGISPHIEIVQSDKNVINYCKKRHKRKAVL